MCSSPPNKCRQAKVKSPISVPLGVKRSSPTPSNSSIVSTTEPSSCWEHMASRSRSAAKKLLRKYRTKPRKNVQVYTVNSKQSIREAYFRRLKQHVPATSDKDNATKLEVILEAISYIHQLQNDLDSSPTFNDAATKQ